jgi:asparagine synthase (glutamine-hydrolysing)
VRKLRPGARLTWTPDGVSLVGWRASPPREDIADPIDAARTLRRRLADAVSACTASDRPIGVLLSGGLDSSAVTALCGLRPLPAWSIRWAEPSWDESAHAATAARAAGATHHLVDCGPADLVERLDALVDAADEPLADESLLPTAMVCEAARAEVAVVLTGDGADELFGGYARYRWKGSDVDYLDVFAAGRRSVLGRLLPHVEALDDWPLARLDECAGASPIARRRWLDLHGYLPDQVLAKLDRVSMRVGLEARAPFLAPAVSLSALSLAPSLLVRDGLAKAVLRDAMAADLAASTLARPKQGFGVPTSPWFRGPLKKWVAARLASGALETLPGLAMDAVRAVVREHCEGQADHARPLFGLLWLESWLRRG